MPVFSLQPLLLQLPLAQAGQLLLVIGISFLVIVLISSTYRFHKMIQLGEEQLATVEDCNDFFFIQVTRYLSKINRVSSGFGVLVVQFTAETSDPRLLQEELLQDLKRVIRGADDKACLFRDDCIAAIIDTEEDNVAALSQRMIRDLTPVMAARPEITAWRAGASRFPTNGLNTQAIIDAATEAMETVSDTGAERLGIAADPSSGDGQIAEGPIGELSKEDKNAALDPLTGVLKPAVVGSYMRKYMAELRRKKEPGSLLCVGINRIDQIIQLHGETVADEAIAGVSKIIQSLTRDCDLIGRYHRDDFMVLMPCTLPQGEMIATRLREAVQKEVFVLQTKRVKVAVSIGIASHPEHGRNLRDLFSGAYRALEVLREWNTAACLVYDPAKHAKKGEHAARR